jgi:uncharacterized protein with HEPN domain
MMKFACIRQLEIIGEASNQITKEIKEDFQRLNGNKLLE